MTTPVSPAAANDAPAKTALHGNLQGLDRQAHRNLRLSKLVHQDHSPARGMNAMFVNAVEFTDVCREYPIVFVRSGDGTSEASANEIAPMAVLGMTRGENLFLEADGSWGASYVPAFLRSYPFALVRTDETNYIVAFDSDWSGFSEKEGERLFTDAGEPTEFMKGVQGYLETLDGEMQRTRAFGQRLMELGLLQDMRFDATIDGGTTLTVDGFLAIDDKKLAELPEAEVVELHRSGILGLIHAHLISMGQMRRLLERRVTRAAKAAA